MSDPASERGHESWFRRAVVLFAVAGALMTAAVAVRLTQLQRATRENRKMALVELPADDLDGGFVLKPTRRGYRLQRGPGPGHRLADGESFEVHGTRFEFHQLATGERRSEVLTMPLSVYAARETDSGPRGGFRRIDIGGDPVGAGDGTRDRIFVDHHRIAEQLRGAARERFATTRGVAHVVPPDGDVFRLTHRTVAVVAEIPGLRREGPQGVEELVVGEAVPFSADDSLAGHGLELRIAIEERYGTAAIRDDTGAIRGHRLVRKPTLVVTAKESGELDGIRCAWLTFRDREGTPATVRLSNRQPVMLYGSRDRIRPLGGHVVPPDLEAEEIGACFARGVSQGAIRLRRGFLVMDGDAETTRRFHDQIAPRTARQLRGLLDRFNRGSAPAWVLVSGTVAGQDLAIPSGWELVSPAGDRRPTVGVRPRAAGLLLPPPGDLVTATVPAGETVRWSLVHSLRTPEDAELILTVDSELPLLVRLDGVVVASAGGGRSELELPVTAGDHDLAIEARYTGRPDDFGETAGIRAHQGGAAPIATRIGRRKCRGWTSSEVRSWPAAHPDDQGYLWFDGLPPVGEDETAFVQLLFDPAGRGEGPRADPELRIETAGVLEEAWLDGRPLATGSPPYLPGEEVSVLPAGGRLLAVRIRQPTALPRDERGGVRLTFSGGALTGLHPRTDVRRMTAVERSELVIVRESGEAATHLVAVRDGGGISSGSRWMIGASGSLLILGGEDPAGNSVFELGDVQVHCRPADESPFTVINGSGRSLPLFRQIDPFRRPYRPFGGFAVHDGWAQPLTHDRDALRPADSQVTYRFGRPTGITGALILARPDGLHRLLVDGDGPMTFPEGVEGSDFLFARSDEAGIWLLDAGTGTAIYRDGHLLIEWVEGAPPQLLAEGDAISCAASGLLLRASGSDGRLTPDRLPGTDLVAVASAARGLTRLSASETTVLACPASPWNISVEVCKGEDPSGIDRNAPRSRCSARSSAVRCRKPSLSKGRSRRGEPPAVTLTTDPSLQIVARDELRAQAALVRRILADAGEPEPTDDLAGAVVVLDAVTGEILAAAVEGDGLDASAAWGLAWFHPGSTFKLVTGLAAAASDDPEVRSMLDGDLPVGLLKAAPGSLVGAEISRLAPGEDRWASETTRPIRLRSRMDNYGGDPMEPHTDLRQAYERSYNVFFGYLALLLHRPLREGWADAGIAAAGDREALLPLAAMAHKLGFGQVLDLVPPDARKGSSLSAPLLDERGRPIASDDPLTGWTGQFPEGLLEDAQMAACGVGQGEVYATPLQMARIAAALGNGGRLVTPSLIAAVDGRATEPRPAEDLDLPPGAVARVRAGLVDVVEGGTASTTFCDNPYRGLLWGKTGSAERPSPEGGHVTDSWFVGVMEPPAERPEDHPLAFACVMPGAGLGATHAAEVVDRLSRHAARTREWAPHMVPRH